jgi:hypothetical protein
MPIANIKEIEGGNQQRENDLAVILQSLTNQGMTERITSLLGSQVDWIFKMRVAHKVHFESVYNYVDANVKDKEIRKLFKKDKQLITDICSLYMHLAVSEIEEKETNLLGLIREIIKQDIITQNEQSKNQDIRM